MTRGWGRRDVLGAASAAVAGSVAGCGYRPARGDLRWRTKSRYDETIVVGDAVLGVDWRWEDRVLEDDNEPGRTRVPNRDRNDAWGDDEGVLDYVTYSAVGQVRTDRDLDLDGVAAGTTVGEDAMYFQTFPDPDPDERDEDDRVTREDAKSWSIVRVTPAFDVTDDPPPTPVEDPYELPPAVEHVTHDLGAREPVAVAVGGERVYGATRQGHLVGYTPDLDERFFRDQVAASYSFAALAADDDGCAFLAGAGDGGRALTRYGTDGTRRWTTTVPGAASDALVTLPEVVCAVGSRVAGFDAATGDRRFLTDDLGDIVPVAADGTTLYVVRDETLLAMDADGGAVRWRFSDGAGGPDVEEPVEAVDDAVVLAAGGRVVALDAADGAVLREYASGAATFLGVTSDSLVLREGDEYVARRR